MRQAIYSAKQLEIERDVWRSKQPDEWVRGDIAIIAGADPLGHGWILAKQHPRDPKLWYCVLRDDWESLVGSTDVRSTSELGVTGVLRTHCATWIHTDDMSIRNRIDRDRDAAVACSEMISRLFTGWGFDLDECETDNDPDYIEHISALMRYTHELTEALHNEN